MKLSPSQITSIKKSFRSSTFSRAREIQKLVDAGFDQETAEQEFAQLIESYREELFAKKMQEEKDEELRKLLFGGVAMVAIIGTFVDSIAYYFVATVLCGIAGYYAYKQKPVAGVAAFVVFSILHPFIHIFYFQNRETYIKIELMFPMLAAALPGSIVYAICSKLFYSSIK